MWMENNMSRQVNTQKILKRACIVRQNAYSIDLLVRREAEALHDDGFQVDVICQRQPGCEAEAVIDGIHVYRLPVGPRTGGAVRSLWSYVSFFLLAALKLTVLHLRHPYALVQVNTMPDFLVFVTLVPRLMGAKVGLFMYEPMPELWATQYNSRLMIRALGIIQRLAIGYAHATFAVTQKQKETFVARGANADKIAVILNVPDTCFWERLVPETMAPKEHFTLICHGVIAERYGHDTMLQAVKRVRGQIPNLRLRILGRGSYLGKFLELIKTLGVEESVDYLGWVSLQEMVAELHNADVGIVAQKSSPYSNLVHTGKMYDYLAFGKPVLASRLKAVQAYFDEDALRFFEPDDPQSLAEAILDLYQNPDKRRMLVENSQRLYNQYKWNMQKEIYLSTYRGLLA
jgi:glycosyltransferase involved in cell wall biosynthesis